MKKIFLLFIFSASFATMFAQLNLPITFDDAAVTYQMTDFGGNASSVGADPAMASNKVGIAVKGVASQIWAGTTLGAPALAAAVPFTASNHKMTVRVYSPAVGALIKLKVEVAGQASQSVETDKATTVANAWETLVFDLDQNSGGTPAFNSALAYNVLSLFFNFGVVGTGETYYFDDIQMGTPSTLNQIDLPVTFEDAAVDYTVTDFGGNASTIGADPMNANNKVAISEKTSSAETWAGTTIGKSTGFITAMPLATNSKITMRVYAPAAGMTVRLKAEVANDPTKSVETDVLTTVANAWETLTFDFTNPASGTAPLNPSYVYQKLSVFFNFGINGATAGAKTFYWDDVMMDKGSSINGDVLADLRYAFDADNAMLTVSHSSRIEQVSVFSLTGQQVATTSVAGNTQNLSLAHVSAGAYMVRCIVDGEFAAFKVIK